jgi:hypothetical protein
MAARRRGAAWLAWGLAAVSLAATAATWVGLAQAGRGGALAVFDEGLISLVPLVSTGVAALIVSRQPRNTIGWLLMTQGLPPALGGPVGVYLKGITTAPEQPGALLLLAVWLDNVSWLFLVFPLFIIALLFPTGRPL